MGVFIVLMLPLIVPMMGLIVIFSPVWIVALIIFPFLAEFLGNATYKLFGFLPFMKKGRVTLYDGKKVKEVPSSIK